MKKVLIVKNSYSINKPILYKINRFKEELKKYNYEVDVLSSLDVFTYFNSSIPSADIDLKQYDFCLFFDKDEVCSSLIEKQIPVFNSTESLINCNDKIKTYISLLNSGINLPKTFIAPLCYSGFYKQETFDLFIEKIEKNLTYPLICKCAYGSLGLQVFLIKNHDELVTKYKELLYTPHLYQEFIQTSKGKDFRIFLVNSKVVSYMERINNEDFRSNISLGGKGYHILPPNEFLQVAIKASKILKLDYAGIDLLIGENNKPYLAEVNSNPFLSEIEKISNTNITKLIVEDIINKLKERKKCYETTNN